jgi:hypothetical protein
MRLAIDAQCLRQVFGELLIERPPYATRRDHAPQNVQGAG